MFSVKVQGIFQLGAVRQTLMHDFLDPVTPDVFSNNRVSVMLHSENPVSALVGHQYVQFSSDGREAIADLIYTESTK